MQQEKELLIELVSADIAKEENLILTDVNLKVYKGDFTYIIGRVGSGKTSIIKTIIGEIPLKKGSGVVSGFSLEKLKEKEIPFLRRRIGVVFQDFQLLSDRSVYENLFFILMATGWRNKKAADNIIKERLESVDMLRKSHKMPHQLSGGEQQRVVIGRALLNDPDIILADEPTGNLDPETSEGIIRLLQEISKTGRAVIVATHNYNLLKKFSARTIKCDEGRLKEVLDDEEMELLM